MTADEALKLTKTYKELAAIFSTIKKACMQGENTITIYLLNKDVKKELGNLGYSLNDEIDDDSNYIHTWISW